MRNPKRTCNRCNKTKRVHDPTTYEMHGACSTCVSRLGLTEYPVSLLLLSPALATEVNPYDLYMSETVNKYAVRGFKGLL